MDEAQCGACGGHHDFKEFGENIARGRLEAQERAKQAQQVVDDLLTRQYAIADEWRAQHWATYKELCCAWAAAPDGPEREHTRVELERLEASSATVTMERGWFRLAIDEATVRAKAATADAAKA